MRQLLGSVVLAVLGVTISLGCSSKTVELPKDSGVPFDKARDSDTRIGGGPPGSSQLPGGMTGKKPLPPPTGGK